MGTKNIFQRLKNGLLGYRTSHEEIPTIQESVEQYRGRSNAPLLWVDSVRKQQLSAIEVKPCCDFPQELTPGVMALYDHHCRFKEKEPVCDETD